MVDLLAVLGAPEPFQQFVVGEVECCELVSGAGLSADHGPPAQDCHLNGQLIAGLPGIGLLGDFRIDPLDLVPKRFDFRDLFPGVFAEPV